MLNLSMTKGDLSFVSNGRGAPNATLDLLLTCVRAAPFLAVLLFTLCQSEPHLQWQSTPPDWKPSSAFSELGTGAIICNW